MYKLVSAEFPVFLEDRVNRELDGGWDLARTPFVWNGQIFQLMVKRPCAYAEFRLLVAEHDLDFEMQLATLVKNGFDFVHGIDGVNFGGVRLEWMGRLHGLKLEFAAENARVVSETPMPVFKMVERVVPLGVLGVS